MPRSSEPAAQRLFVAVELPPEARAALAGLQEAAAGGAPAPKERAAGIGWVREEQLHLTVRFIGAVNAETREALAAAVRGLAVAPFEMRLAGAGAFPVGQSPEVLWIGVDEGATELGELRARVDDLLDGAGIAREARRFHPHITLARVRDRPAAGEAAAWVRRHEGRAGPRVRVEGVTLFRTHFGEGRAEHEPIARSATAA
jgi:2'-5' RNA ligase